MPLDRYANACIGIAEELKEELDYDQREGVRETLSSVPYLEWLRWRRDNEAMVRAVATAAPAKRAKLLARVDDTDRPALILAACQYCLEAAELLRAVSIHCIPGLSYRDMVGAAHRAIEEFESEDLSLWPWEGDPPYVDFPRSDEASG